MDQHNPSLYYEFELKVHRIYLELDSVCDVQFWWRRGKNKATSKKYRINERVQYVEMNEGLKTCVKVKFKEGRVVPFTTDITVLLYPLTNPNSCKQGGNIPNFDATQILLPENRKASVSRQFDKKLENSLPNSKIVFTLSSKFLREAGNEQSLNDISFQGTSALSHFNHSHTDMTFRPPINSEERTRKSRNKDVSPVLRSNDLQQKLESPLQRVDYIKVENPREEGEYAKNDKPLGFSFGPVGNPMGNPQRERQNKALLDEVNHLREELLVQKKDNERLVAQLRARDAERNTGVDDKKLLLLNQLNAAVNQCDQLKREKEEAGNQLIKIREDYRKLREEIKEKELLYGKAKDESREIGFNFNKIRDQFTQCSQRYQSKRKQHEQLRARCDKMQRENEQMKNQLFKKQSELISHQSQLENANMQCMNANKNLPVMQELKRVNQDLGKQRADLEKANNQMAAALQREQGLREQLAKQLRGAKEELQAMKGKFIESYKHQESQFHFQIREIEEEMNHLMAERQEKEQQHAAQISQLMAKNQELTQRIEEESAKQHTTASQEIQSLKIQVSELKVRIKHHEEIYVNLQKDYAQKEKEVMAKSEFIEKVREYVVKIEEENREKDTAIKERDEFIARAKEFITNKEADLMAQIEKYKKEILVYKQKAEASQKLRNDLTLLSTQSKQKQKFMGDIVRQTNEKQFRIQQLEAHNEEMHMILTQMERKIQEMQGYIEMQNERFQTNMDEVEELNRRIKSQQQTLEDLVKKNLDMEMEINLKNFQLRSIRGR